MWCVWGVRIQITLHLQEQRQYLPVPMCLCPVEMLRPWSFTRACNSLLPGHCQCHRGRSGWLTTEQVVSVLPLTCSCSMLSRSVALAGAADLGERIPLVLVGASRVLLFVSCTSTALFCVECAPEECSHWETPGI